MRHASMLWGNVEQKKIYDLSNIENPTAIVIGTTDHGTKTPKDGTVQNDPADGLEVWKTADVIIGHEENDITESQTRWFKVSTEEHDHEIGNQKLLFENALI